MKNLSSSGKTLTRDEQRTILGGDPPNCPNAYPCWDELYQAWFICCDDD